jgi:hypothetical protein
MNNEEYIFIKGTDQKLEIPPEGCLGLLALGDVGLKIWRQKVAEAKAVATKGQKTNENKED